MARGILTFKFPQYRFDLGTGAQTGPYAVPRTSSAKPGGASDGHPLESRPKIRKSERYGGHERFIQEQIEAVLVLFKPARPGLPPTFPRTLDLQAQGRFALGFYQQNAAEAAARQAHKKDPTTKLTPVETV